MQLSVDLCLVCSWPGVSRVFGDYAEGIVSVPVSDQGVVTDIDTADDLEGA